MSTNTEQLKRAIQLTEQINSLQGELDRILSGLKVGGSSVAAAASAPAPTPGKRGRKKGGMSAAGRAAIVAAQKARWAKIKAAKGGKAPAAASPKAAAKPAKKKRTFSAAARAKMAAAAKARWAKQKKGK